MIAAFRLSIRVGACLLLALASVALAQSESQVSAPMMNQLVTDYLTEAGFTPPADANLHMSDYVTILSTDDTPRVGVYIDKNGMLTPNPSWHQFNSEYCLHYAREILEPVRLLSIRAYKVVETSEGFTRSQYFVFGSLIDAETNFIQYQEEAAATTARDHDAIVRDNPDYEALGDTLPGLLETLLAKAGVAGMADPCGDLLVTHVEGNQVRSPALFLAGYEGGYGNHLTYTWDFGDGSPAAELGKSPMHVYAESGTYTVTVVVTGDAIDPMTGGVVVTIGGNYALFFENTSVYTAQGESVEITVRGSIDLAPDADGNFVGNGKIAGASFSGSAIAAIGQAGCTANLVSGPTSARVRNLSDPQNVAIAVRFDFSGAGFPNLPGAEIICGGPMAAMMSQMFSHLGKSWGPAFVVLHEPAFVEGNYYEFTNLRQGSGNVLYSKSLADTVVVDGAQVRSTTTLEVRNQE